MAASKRDLQNKLQASVSDLDRCNDAKELKTTAVEESGNDEEKLGDDEEEVGKPCEIAFTPPRISDLEQSQNPKVKALLDLIRKKEGIWLRTTAEEPVEEVQAPVLELLTCWKCEFITDNSRTLTRHANMAHRVEVTDKNEVLAASNTSKRSSKLQFQNRTEIMMQKS